MGLLCIAWPQARELAEPRSLADAVDGDLDTQPQQDGHGLQDRWGAERSIYARPPLNARVCASVLALADQLLTVDDPLVARERLQLLLAQAATQWRWRRHVLAAEAHCSPGLRATIAPQVLELQPRGRTGRKPGSRHPPSRACRFGPQHIPQYLPAGWFDRYLGDLVGVSAHLLRRFASIRLVQMVAGGSQATAADFLGLPPSRYQPATFAVQRWTRDATGKRALDAALEALARELDAAEDLIDYRHRRDALQAWSLPADDWHELAEAASHLQHPRDRARTDWADRKRRIASVVVWTRVTQGEHLFALLALADDLATAQRRELIRSVGQVRRHGRTGKAGQHAGQHYVALLRALDAYADRLAAQIDAGLFESIR